MASKIWTAFLPEREDVMYDAAMKALNGIDQILRLESEGKEIDVDIRKNIFHKLFRGKDSPSILWLDEKQYVVYYPPNSRPFTHDYKDQCKFAEVLKGVLYDSNSEKKYFKGDRVKILPSSSHLPHTKDEEAYLRVIVGDCSLSIKDVFS